MSTIETAVPDDIEAKITELCEVVVGEDGWTLFLVVGRNNGDRVEFRSNIVTESDKEGEEYLPWPLGVLAQIHNDKDAMEKLADYLEGQMEVDHSEEVKH